MPTTLNPTCPLCGLRYADRPLLELHLREDHRRPDQGPRPDPAPAAPAAPADPAAPPTRRSDPGWARTALHRVLWSLRYASAELTRVFGRWSGRGR